MGQVASQLLNDKSPQIRPAFQPLAGWSREAIIAAAENFKQQRKHALDRETFCYCLSALDKEDVRKAFNEMSSGRSEVDYLTVVGAMIALSDQSYISRISMLFSFYDLDGGCALNKAEFYIGLHSLFHGLSTFVVGAKKPRKADLEYLAQTVFNRLDCTKCGEVFLGEILSYAYRSEELVSLLGRFPSDQRQTFEQGVCFSLDRSVAAPKPDGTGSSESLRNQVRISPDCEPLRLKKVRRRCRTSYPKTIHMDHAWLIWAFFQALADKATRCICHESLHALLEEHDGIKQITESLFETRHCCIDSKARFSLAASSLYRSLTAEHAHRELKWLGKTDVSFRALCCIVWPHVIESDVECVLGWARSFQSQAVLQTLLKENKEGTSENHQLDIKLCADDIHVLFEAFDANGDGRLSVEELCRQGLLPRNDAEKFIRTWDRDHSGGLSEDECVSILFNLDTVLGEHIKGLFTAAQMEHRAES